MFFPLPAPRAFSTAMGKKGAAKKVLDLVAKGSAAEYQLAIEQEVGHLKEVGMGQTGA